MISRYTYHHHIIYNDITYSMCPWDNEDPLNMLSIGTNQIEFDPFKESDCFISDTINIFTTYKIVQSKLYIYSTKVSYLNPSTIEINYFESLDKIFKNIDSNGVFADFVTCAFVFDNEEISNEDNIDKYYCIVKEGIVKEISKNKKSFEYAVLENNIIKLYEEYEKRHGFRNKIPRINFQSSKNSKYFPIINTKKNNLFYQMGYSTESLLSNTVSRKLNSYEKDTYDELTDGNNGDYRDYDADISDLLDNMGRG